LPFSRQWACKVMVIAENDSLSNVKHALHLPADLETVYQLSLMAGNKLFRDHANPVDGALPLGRQWACRLMSMADNEVVTNVDYSLHLPNDLNTVHQLSLMAGNKLEKAIEADQPIACSRSMRAAALCSAARSPVRCASSCSRRCASSSACTRKRSMVLRRAT